MSNIALDNLVIRPAVAGGRRIGLVFIWVVATVGIAFLVARHESTRTGDDASASVPPIQVNQRAVVSLATKSISPVVAGDGIVVADGPVFDLQAPVKPEDLAYQLLNPPYAVKALIVGGPVGFDCAWLGIAQAGDGGMAMRCRIPGEVKVVAGLSGKMVLSMSKPVDAQALPVTAVVGSADRGQVIVVDSAGKTSVREVSLGIADSFWIQITSGLGANETVLENPVQSDFAASSP